MSVSIRTNIPSLNAQRNLSTTQKNLDLSLSKLSSGLRVRNAADDAAGLAISEKMKAQIRSLNQAYRNAADGISLIQTAEGALNEVHSIMDRLRELAIHSANDVLSDIDRSFLNDEFTELIDEVDRIARVTEFNSHPLLDGTQATGLAFQVGIGPDSDDRLIVSIPNCRTSQMGTGLSTLNLMGVSTVTRALQSLDVIDASIYDISEVRAKLGAIQNRLTVTQNNLSSYAENLSAANSQIRDVDVAFQTAELTKDQILMQAGVSVLSQANQLPSTALSLINGN
ncbi:flagellin FliC [Myxococcota bacterium]|nr:flagellin FliC [Myxococcota bacterium]MBU1382415.1 flagellin FliC [Myxococcota bacterium]MBU1496574.1 flagellin FliC [Myxococcota bacterium]